MYLPDPRAQPQPAVGVLHGRLKILRAGEAQPPPAVGTSAGKRIHVAADLKSRPAGAVPVLPHYAGNIHVVRGVYAEVSLVHDKFLIKLRLRLNVAVLNHHGSDRDIHGYLRPRLAERLVAGDIKRIVGARLPSENVSAFYLRKLRIVGIKPVGKSATEGLRVVVPSAAKVRYIRCQKLRLFIACHFAHNAESAVFIVTHAVFVSRDCLSLRFRKYHAVRAGARLKRNYTVLAGNAPSYIFRAERFLIGNIAQPGGPAKLHHNFRSAVQPQHCAVRQCEAMPLKVSLSLRTEQLNRKLPGYFGARYDVLGGGGHENIGQLCRNCKEPFRGLEHYALLAPVREKLSSLFYVYALLRALGYARCGSTHCGGHRLRADAEHIQEFKTAFVRESVQAVNSTAEHLREQHCKRRSAVRGLRVKAPLRSVRAAFPADKGKNIRSGSAVKFWHIHLPSPSIM